ncbi:MAG TPA: TraR/DksA C4-type zinc finger protein [Mycobacteriales bacterium]|nr:TraR/DksA C4-type zinc finger protein [Mycobacteriales bacterium]
MDVAARKAALQEEAAATQTQRDRLRRDVDDVIAGAADVATDDEHDPEGATIAYERSRLTALLEQAETHLGDIDGALERLESGSYGVCESCGGEISSERLDARPTVRTCISCATTK